MQLTATLQAPPTVSGIEKGHPRQRAPSLPLIDEHADVALVDIRDIKVLTRMSDSWIYEAVRTGDFPAPVIRRPRCTRWTLASVRSWLKQQAHPTGPDAAESTKAAEAQRQAHHQLMERAYHVSKVAQAKARRRAAQGTGGADK
jgi:prophage regulatory protein